MSGTRKETAPSRPGTNRGSSGPYDARFGAGFGRDAQGGGLPRPPRPRLLQALVTRALVRGLAKKALRIALWLAAVPTLFGLLYAPFSGWGPFSGPSPLDGCPKADPNPLFLLREGTPEELATFFMHWAQAMLFSLSVPGFLIAAMMLGIGCNYALHLAVIRLLRASLVGAAIGWVLAVCLGLAPC